MTWNAWGRIALVVAALAMAMTPRAAVAQVGACCLDCAGGENCMNVIEADCDVMGGQFQGAGTMCSTVDCQPFAPCPPDCIKPGVGIFVTAFYAAGGVIEPGEFVIPGLEMRYQIQLSIPSSPAGVCDAFGGQLAMILPNWMTFTNPGNGQPPLESCPSITDCIAVAGYPGTPDIPLIGALPKGVPFIMEVPTSYFADPVDADAFNLLQAHADYGQTGFLTFHGIFQQPGTALTVPEQPVNAATAISTPLRIPTIDLVKSADPSTICAGQDKLVTYTYMVSNPSDVDLQIVSLVDSQPACGTLCAIPPGANCPPDDDDCPPMMGDNNGDGLLNPGEMWIYQCVTSISQTTTNIATVTAFGVVTFENPDNNICVTTHTYTATDDATVTAVGTPACQINGPPLVCPGASNLTYTVTETTGIPGATFSWSILGDASFCPGTPTTGPSVCVNTNAVCPGAFTLTVTVSAGLCSNMCTFPVTIDDDVPPVITCPPSMVFECDERINAGMATATDNCPIPPLVIASDMAQRGDCPQEMVITRTWTATDFCGNQSSCAQIITVVDTTPPVITCPPGFAVQCPADVLPCNPADASATDNCDPTVMITCTSGPLVGGPCGGTVTRTYTATDDCGNTASCQQVITVNACAIIGDRVWRDDNGNGCQDAGEGGVGGVTVTLLSECNTPIAMVLTMSDGLYEFRDLCPGSYRVRFDPPPPPFDLVETTPNAGCGANSDAFDSDCVNGLSDCITLAAGEVNLTIDCGLRCTGVIGDRVWRDDNRNGCQDAGEQGLGSVTVNLFRECTQIELIATTATSASGIYQFTGLCAGDYLVQFIAPAGFVETTPNATCGGPGGSDANDSDCLNGFVCVTLSGNDQVNNTIDCGLQCTGVIGDFIWFDENRDGCQDSTETGLGGLTVTLFTSCTAPQMVASTVTDPNGFYQFDNLCPADYRIVVQQAPDLVPSPPNQPCEGPDPADELDSDCVDGAICQTLGLNEMDLSNDCGFRERPTCCDPERPGDGGPGECDAPHDDPCCRVERCCELVCPIDPTCCQIVWDQTCVDIALEVCLPDPPICPGEGSCNQPHDTPGCEDLACCSLICFIDYYCCTVEWNDECVDAANAFCGLFAGTDPAPADDPAAGPRAPARHAGGSWFDAAAWSTRDVPGPAGDAVIDGRVFVNVGGALARDVHVAQGGVLTLAAGSLTARSLIVEPGGAIVLAGEQAKVVVQSLTIASGAGFDWSGGLIEISGTWIHPTTLAVGERAASVLRVTGSARVVAPLVAIRALGILSGEGTIAGPVENDGRIEPGTGPGRLTIDGSFAQRAAGRLIVEVAAGTGAGTGADAGAVAHDRLRVTGAAVFAGALDVHFTATGKAGERFAVVTGSPVSGRFENVTVPALEGGLSIAVRFEPGRIALAVEAAKPARDE